MSKLPTMPFMVDAYLADTSHLTLEEHGAYLLLLFAMWRRNGSIPDSDSDNARMLGLQPRAWLRLKPRLLPFFQVVGENLVQKRLQLEWNNAQDNRRRQSEKGKAGAKERWERSQLLNSNRRHNTGISQTDAAASSPGNGTGYGRQIASIHNNNTSSNLTTAEAPEVDPSDASKNADKNPLLKTRLMKRTEPFA